jgi:hypothetical protein
MAIFKIKLEDKAAFLNQMEKAGAELNTNQMVDNEFKGYFEVTIDEPKQLQIAKGILKQSPKITQMENNKKKMTKDELKEMVRQQLQAVLSEKKKVKDEDKKDKLDENEETLNEDLFTELIPILATILGVGGTIAASFYRELKGKSKEEKEQILRSVSGQINRSKGIEN